MAVFSQTFLRLRVDYFAAGQGPIGPQGDPGPVENTVLDVFSVTNGQTFFACSQVPRGSVALSVNGVLAKAGVDYTQTFAVVTWTNAAFTLDTQDVVTLSYVS